MIAFKFFIFVTVYTVSLDLFWVYVKLIEILEIGGSLLKSGLYKLDPVYDYVIVGCGSAGSIVALRLSEERNASVLVLEAGPTGTSWFDIPAVAILLRLSSVDWQYNTVPQENAAKALEDHVSKWPTGRVGGGSGRLNSLLYMRGHREDFRGWSQDPSAYNYESDILHYFKKSEDHRGAYKNDLKYHSTGGPLIVEDFLHITALGNAILKAAETLGYLIRDLNGQHSTGFMRSQINIKSGGRWLPLHHLLSLSRPNLVIQSNSFVEKVLFKSDYEAYGVQYTHLGVKANVRARKGVILSAGSVGTPKLLMLSGVGKRAHLSNVGIRTRVDLPVGDNLQDHVTTGLDLVLLNTSVLDVFKMYYPSTIFNYFYHGTGMWTGTGCEVLGVLSTKCLNSSLEYNQNCLNDEKLQPDLQILVMPLGAASDGGKHLVNVVGYNDITRENYIEPLVRQSTISLIPVVLHPKSRGTVRLSNRDPYNRPLIDPKYLSDPYDVTILLKGIEIIKKIISTQPMQQLGAKLNTRKIPGCVTFEFDTEAYWECYVRHLTMTAYHPIGTCKIGNSFDKESVTRL
ncbi:hypothetical protein PPYR_13507 [Photinus pyralis]|uniref:Glucose-methanol-choline oxidoreductase N-terminal domain-containing protein n=1 Tax=Photinus pyralis TaxID=7054 RepID=A0A5N4A9A1_PHOPY|nr:glucose dehydrogenase [FAD, quinone]-like isoform X2 [Photinus pyralis]KAB0793887.1 hypothetical protein PPYR_13507 [Photinus pyralis]